jgi:hypothetical protein
MFGSDKHDVIHRSFKPAFSWPCYWQHALPLILACASLLEFICNLCLVSLVKTVTCGKSAKSGIASRLVSWMQSSFACMLHRI